MHETAFGAFTCVATRQKLVGGYPIFLDNLTQDKYYVIYINEFLETIHFFFSTSSSPHLFHHTLFHTLFPYTGPSLSSFLVFYSFCWFTVASCGTLTISASNLQLHYFEPMVYEPELPLPNGVSAVAAQSLFDPKVFFVRNLKRSGIISIPVRMVS